MANLGDEQEVRLLAVEEVHLPAEVRERWAMGDHLPEELAPQVAHQNLLCPSL